VTIDELFFEAVSGSKDYSEKFHPGETLVLESLWDPVIEIVENLHKKASGARWSYDKNEYIFIWLFGCIGVSI
tara:strand:+ start:261 stop:479 length:219 start_codon:yes stop_codon:yes gene_type:complete